MARGASRSRQRRAPRRAVPRQEPGLLAHRDRGAHARRRPERRGVHDAQEHGAQPARRRRALRAARRGLRRVEHGPGAQVVVSGISLPARQRRGVLRVVRLGVHHRGPWPWRQVTIARGRVRHGQLLPGAGGRRGARAHAAAVGRSGRRAASGGGDQRRPVASRLRGRSGHHRPVHRDQQRAAHGRRRGRPRVSRHHRQLRHRAVHPGDDGAADGLQLRQPGVVCLRRFSRTRGPRSSFPRASSAPASRSMPPPRRPTRSGRRSPATGRWAMRRNG